MLNSIIAESLHNASSVQTEWVDDWCCRRNDKLHETHKSTRSHQSITRVNPNKDYFEKKKRKNEKASKNPNDDKGNICFTCSSPHNTHRTTIVDCCRLFYCFSKMLQKSHTENLLICQFVYFHSENIPTKKGRTIFRRGNTITEFIIGCYYESLSDGVINITYLTRTIVWFTISAVCFRIDKLVYCCFENLWTISHASKSKWLNINLSTWKWQINWIKDSDMCYIWWVICWNISDKKFWQSLWQVLKSHIACSPWNSSILLDFFHLLFKSNPKYMRGLHRNYFNHFEKKR